MAVFPHALNFAWSTMALHRLANKAMMPQG
jgi:hypothetical protein